MCFSASASFAASGALLIVGGATIAKTKDKKSLPLAFIPLIFGIQQFIEGLLWLSISQTGTANLELTVAFAFFALLIWPTYMPLVAYWLETDSLRKKSMSVFCLFGFMFGLYIYSLFLESRAPAVVINRCITYSFHPANYIWFGFLYGIFTLGAGFLSSKRVFNWFCFLVGLSALFTWYMYEFNFISVWCFFAALLSLMLYFHADQKLFKAK